MARNSAHPYVSPSADERDGAEFDGRGGDREPYATGWQGRPPSDGHGGDHSGPPADSGSMAAEWNRQWHEVRRELRYELGDAAYDSWLRPLDLLSIEAGKAVLSVPTKFMRDWIDQNYIDSLVGQWARVNPSVRGIEIVLNGRGLPPVRQDSQPDPRPSFDAPAGKSRAAPEPAAQPVAAPAPQAEMNGYGAPADERAPGMPTYLAEDEDTGLAGKLEQKYTFDQFVVGKSNELAHAAARRVAESDTVPFNPLFLHGSTGLGKTHLMHAIAWEVRRRNPARKVLCLSAEKFMYRFVAAIRHHSQLAFKEQFRNVDVLMIDDFQFLGGKTTTQEEFFHTFNTLVDRNRQVIISADKSPSDLENIEERIRSRLSWGLVADIHPTDYELRLGILQTKARQAVEIYGEIDIPQQVLDFLAHRITSNVRELEGALHRILAHASLVGRAVNVDMAQEVLKPLIRANARKVTVEEIQRRVADYFDIKQQDLLSQRRARVVTRPRQIAMYLAKHLTTRSLPDIGRRFGGRDHTTVMHAVRRIEELRRSDPLIDDSVENLRRLLEG